MVLYIYLLIISLFIKLYYFIHELVKIMAWIAPSPENIYVEVLIPITLEWLYLEIGFLER